jgi:hypothetical protein
MGRKGSLENQTASSGNNLWTFSPPFLFISFLFLYFFFPLPEYMMVLGGFLTQMDVLADTLVVRDVMFNVTDNYTAPSDDQPSA